MSCNWSSSATDDWINLWRCYRIGTWARVSIKQLLKVVIWVETLHSWMEGLCCGRWLKEGTAFTWVGSRLWHLWIETCVFMEPILTHIGKWFTFRTIETSICWFRGWDWILFIDNDSNSTTRNRRCWCNTIYKRRQLFRLNCRSSSKTFGMSRRQSSARFIIISSCEHFPSIIRLGFLTTTENIIIVTALSWTEFISVPAHH
jgi:hypothetical protein